MPVRDRGIDVIAYVDSDRRVSSFTACPIQMKAASVRSFTINGRFERLHNLLLAYVWDVDDPKQTATYALTYMEALQIADEFGWTQTQAWIQNKEYSTTTPSAELTTRLLPYRMTPDAWWKKVTRSMEEDTYCTTRPPHHVSTNTGRHGSLTLRAS